MAANQQHTVSMAASRAAVSLALLLSLVGCKSSDGPSSCDIASPSCSGGSVCLDLDGMGGVCTATCDPAAADACDAGLTCDPVGSSYACFPPVTITGVIFEGDAMSTTGVEGARVLAANSQGSVITEVAVTDADGRYSLEVPVVRDATGAPVDGTYTLRVSAADFQNFPSNFRPALPIDASTGQGDNTDGYVVENATTSVLLIGLDPADTGRPSVSGTLAGDGRAGALVVAECGTPPCPFAYADDQGAYTIFNVPAGMYEVRSYAAGVVNDGVMVTVADMDLDAVDLPESMDGTATIDGSLQIVNPESGTATSVVLIPESTFVQLAPSFVRGEVAPGLRAPDPGMAPDITGAYSIEGVPPGRYVVLAAFENDFLVRDPDPGIAGTQIVSVDVAGSDITVMESFKVTGALVTIGPGADGPEAVDPMSTITLQWEDDSSEDSFDVEVYDALGTRVWNTTVARFTGSGNPSVDYAGPLEAGMYYQWRAVSRDGGGDALSTTEDLRGVFYVPAMSMTMP